MTEPSIQAADVDEYLHVLRPLPAGESVGAVFGSSMMPAGPTLHGELARVAARHPDDEAIIFGTEHFSFSDLLAEAEQFARAVATVTAPGDRVAVIAWNGPWWVQAYFGVPMSGRILTMVSPRLTTPEIVALLNQVDVRLVIIDSTIVENLSLLEAPGREVVDLATWRQRMKQAEPTGGLADVAAGDSVTATDDFAPAWLVFTSGTTSTPKAAALTHRSLLAAVAATVAVRPIPSDDTYLFPFPLWHVAGYNVVSQLLAGRPVIIHARFDPVELIDEVARHQATSVSMAATMLQAVLDAAERSQGTIRSLSSLRQLNYGAAPMPISLLRRAADLLDVGFWQGYGMTELSGNAVFLTADDHAAGLQGDERILSATGRPAPGVDLRIVDADRVELPVGQVGEIEVRAPQAMHGYWNDGPATASTVHADGWLSTGDVGTLDESGLLRLLDRKKDVIITGGENVSAREVEEVLRRHPSIADVAVVGVKDERWGENVCAVVVPVGQTVDSDELRLWARRQLAGYKVPRHVVVRASLPVNASGKVVKAEIREWLAQNPSEIDARS